MKLSDSLQAEEARFVLKFAVCVRALSLGLPASITTIVSDFVVVGLTECKESL